MDRRSFMQLAAGLAAIETLPCVAAAAVEDSKRFTHKLRQIVFDIKTTVPETKQGRIVELTCIELINYKKTGNIFHCYINPDCEIDANASEWLGRLSQERLKNEPKFTEIAPALIDFIRGAELIILSGPFDVHFLNNELAIAGMHPLKAYSSAIIDIIKYAEEIKSGEINSMNMNELYDHSLIVGYLHDDEDGRFVLADLYLSTRSNNVV